MPKPRYREDTIEGLDMVDKPQQSKSTTTESKSLFGKVKKLWRKEEKDGEKKKKKKKKKKKSKEKDIGTKTSSCCWSSSWCGSTRSRQERNSSSCSCIFDAIHYIHYKKIWIL
ncbi:hypothetical protein ACFXTH_031692 [Malus domestica]